MSHLVYEFAQPNTGEEIWPNKSRVWAYDKKTHESHVAENKIYWGKDGKSKSPRLKKFLTDAKPVVPRSIWGYQEAGHNSEANLEMRDIFGSQVFSSPKPSKLIQRILQVGSDANSLILDSFGGSGTTAQAVLKQNAEDGGNRRFILVEMDENIARDVTAERVRRVARGYANAKGKKVEGLGGGFQFCRLSSEPLFDANGQIRGDVTFSQLAEFVWFAETGSGFSGKADSPLIGMHQGRAVYLLYNGILKDKSINGGNVLTSPVLNVLPEHDGPKVIYAAACRLGQARLDKLGIQFKQTPYALEV